MRAGKILRSLLCSPHRPHCICDSQTTNMQERILVRPRSTDQTPFFIPAEWKTGSVTQVGAVSGAAHLALSARMLLYDFNLSILGLLCFKPWFTHASTSTGMHATTSFPCRCNMAGDPEGSNKYQAQSSTFWKPTFPETREARSFVNLAAWQSPVPDILGKLGQARPRVTSNSSSDISPTTDTIIIKIILMGTRRCQWC